MEGSVCSGMVYLRIAAFAMMTKMVSLRWLLAFIILCTFPLYGLFEIHEVAAVTGTELNLFDLVFYQFGLYTNLFLLIFPLYIFLISDLFHDNEMEVYLILRVGGRKNWFFYKIPALFYPGLSGAGGWSLCLRRQFCLAI